MIGGYGETIPDFFKKYRQQSGYSQADLGRLLKVTPQYICNVENGRNPRPGKLAYRLMKFLDPKRQSHLDELIRQAVWEFSEDRFKERRHVKKGKQPRNNSGKHP